MNVIRAPFEVLFIPNGVFLESRLPYTAFAAFSL